MNALSSVKNYAGIYYISPMCVGHSPAPSQSGYTLGMITGALLVSLDLDLAPFAIFDWVVCTPCRRWTAKYAGDVIVDWLKTTRESLPSILQLGVLLKRLLSELISELKADGKSRVYKFGRVCLLVIEGVD